MMNHIIYCQPQVTSLQLSTEFGALYKTNSFTYQSVSQEWTKRSRNEGKLTCYDIFNYVEISHNILQFQYIQSFRMTQSQSRISCVSIVDNSELMKLRRCSSCVSFKKDTHSRNRKHVAHILFILCIIVCASGILTLSRPEVN